MNNIPTPLPCENRRGFLAKAAVVVCGLVACAVPAAAGLVAFLNPLRQKSQAGRFLRLASLDMLPEDGQPRRFPVIARRTDAWTLFPNEPVGAVFLRRTGENEVEALQVVCPHAGCFIVFDEQNRDFACPCHAARFELSGQRIDPAKSPSPRGMDVLPSEVRNGAEVWVRFETFRTGTPEKIVES